MSGDAPRLARDLIGYGRDVPRVEWPGGARVAISLVLNYEEGSERSVELGDQQHESLGELARRVDPAYRDLAVESVYEYGSRAGVHRVLRLFDAYGVTCTFFAAAVALERNPEVAHSLRVGGHEPCAHGHRWSEDWLVDGDEQRARIARAVASITRTCGQRPLGWYSRWMPSELTRQLLVEEGGFLYDSDAYNDDLPYYTRVSGRDHLVVPYTLTYNDARFTADGYTPADFLDVCRRGFDYLWEEGATRPRMMSIGLHPRLIGQAARTSALRDFLEHAQQRGEVWFATRAEIARHWIETQPPDRQRAARA
jgi:peptidoglycan/xylan/chitin deacetylase (PgdA/CDA1 family)